MDFKEAVEWLTEKEPFEDASNCCPTSKEAINIVLKSLRRGEIKEALEKQNQKPLAKTTSTLRCPRCRKQITSRGCIHANYRYCRWCGQRIDWGE